MKSLPAIRLCIFALFVGILYGGGVSLKAQNPCDNTYPWPQLGDIGIKTTSPEKPLHIDSKSDDCVDPAIKLSYTSEVDMPFWGYLVLNTAHNYNLYSSIADEGDLLLSSNARAENGFLSDIIISARKHTGSIRFATTPESEGDDFERMTIIPDGNIGIRNPAPQNLLTTDLTLGMDFWNDDINFQDVRFNCYSSLEEEREGGDLKDTSGGERSYYESHYNVTPGYSSVIQSKIQPGQGTMLLLVSNYHENPDSELEFFEITGGPPKGICLQNYDLQVGDTPVDYNVTNIGLGSLSDPYSRVEIKGRTSDAEMNALSIINWDNENLFTVRNDGNIGIGTESPNKKLHVAGNVQVGSMWYTPQLPPELEYRLAVNAQIVAKEIKVSDNDWADFVFKEDYVLKDIKEVENFIQENKHLPDIPTKEEISKEGVNVGEMQAKLLQKIEELTLYVIELKKENEKLNEKIDKIEDK